MNIRDYDPAKGDACQGDVIFFRIPDHITISTTEEIQPVAGKLIIQEGEVTGHHHAIALPRRNFKPEVEVGDPVLTTRSLQLRKAFAAKPGGTARLYRDPAAIETLRRCGELVRTDLAIGLLVVEGGPVVLTHDEHAGIRFPEGRYYAGRQIESAGAEERIVAD